MQANRTLMPYTGPSPESTVRSSWTRAYLRFLFSKDESLVLKAAPLAFVGLLPIDLLSNIIPAVGELDDFGYLIAIAIIAFRTINRVRKYR